MSDTASRANESAPLRALSITLAAKIGLTLGAWCVPLLGFPASLLRELGFPAPEPMIYLRLLGMAYLSLVLGYGFALQAARRGVYPRATVWVGILSNGGACGVLFLAATQGTWDDWGALARTAMVASTFGTGMLAAALAWFGPLAHAR